MWETNSIVLLNIQDKLFKGCPWAKIVSGSNGINFFRNDLIFITRKIKVLCKIVK